MTDTPQDKPLPETIDSILDEINNTGLDIRKEAKASLLAAFERSMLEVIGDNWVMPDSQGLALQQAAVANEVKSEQHARLQQLLGVSDD